MAVLKDLIVHGNSRFINGAQFDSLSASKISAEEGIFNKLVATNLEATEASITNLTATNAKVVGLLDVQGEMHTKSWTNANISNVGGSFYISPTVSTVIAANNTPMSITIGGSANARTFQVSGGTFATDAVKIYNGTATSTASWAVGSHVMVTGNIRSGTTGVDYPLGTLTGYLTGALSASGFTVGEISSPALETILGELGTSNLKSYEIKISMFEIGPKASIKPVGIMMTSYGVDKSTYIDIYGGVNVKNSSGVTIPNVRIGYLGGLGALNAVNGETPTGWGIYTDNGYFNGVIVSQSGKIGNFTLDTSLRDKKTSYNETTNDGIFLGTTGIGLGKGIFSVSPTGYLTAKSGSIAGWTFNTTSLYKNNATPGASGTTLVMSTGTNSSNSIAGSTGTNTWMLSAGTGFGVTTSGVLYATGAKVAGDVTVSKLTVNSGATISDTNGLISNSAIKVGGKNLLGNTENPTTPTGSNSAAEMTFRSIGRYNSPDSEFSLEDYDGYSNSIVITSTATGNRGVSWYTKPASIIAGETYTFSCRAKTNVAATVHTHTAWRNGSATATYTGWTSGGSKTTVANTWFDYSYTFQPASNAQLDWEFLVALCFTGQTGGVTCHIAHAKLERGNKATDWTPAPEDVDSDIADAQSTANSAAGDANLAKENASMAQATANEAKDSITNIESLVGTSSWTTSHGICRKSSDTEVNEAKTYYTVSATAVANPTGNPHKGLYYELSNGVYTITSDNVVVSGKTYYKLSATKVSNPTGNPSTSGYYEIDLNESIEDYLASHIKMDANGISITDGSPSQVQVNSTGISIWNGNTMIASYGAAAQIGSPNGFHILIGGDNNNNEIGFYEGQNKAAYINGQELYVENSLSFGNFIFYQRQNGHFTLKLV